MSKSTDDHLKDLSLRKQSLIFSAHSLQTYVDCARRFELSYLEKLVWPAVEREPVLQSEHFLEHGRIFHEMVHQRILGIPVLPESIERNPDIARWWQNFQASQPATFDGQTFPEKTLVGEIDGQILVATYDLIVLSPKGLVTIFDWKTWRHPERVKKLEQRLQSRIYPFLLLQAASTLAPDLQLIPEQITMHYWFAERPEASFVFEYSQEKYVSDEAYLSELIAEVLQTEAGAFALTEDAKKCKYCPYRSYCDRGDVAGSISDEESLEDPDMGAELLGNLDDYEAVAF